MGGCSLSQSGEDFYITGVDGTKKKLGEVANSHIILLKNYSTISSVSKVSGYTNAKVSVQSDKTIFISNPTNQGGEVTGAIDDAFDLTDYNTAYVLLAQTTSSAYGSIHYGFSTTKSSSYVISASHSNSTSGGATKYTGQVFDLSSLSGKYYFCFNIPNHGYSSSVIFYAIIFQK